MISFIVAAYNEERCLAKTLDALHSAGRALGETYELVVADDGSTDRTVAIAQERGARVVSATNRQIAATRNSGAQEATGELLIFVDADTIVNELVVRCAVQAVRAGAVGGGAAIKFDDPVPTHTRDCCCALLFASFAESVGQLGVSCSVLAAPFPAQAALMNDSTAQKKLQ